MKEVKNIAASLLLSIATCAASAQEIDISPLELMDDAQTIYPTVLDSTLYFASNHKWNIGKSYFNQNDQHLFQLFCVDLKDGKPDGRPRTYLGAGRAYNMFAVAFDKDGRAYISQNNMQASIVRGAPVSIYVYDSDDDDAQGNRLSQLPTKASCGMATVSPNQNLLIFASDMRGGEGRVDLYYCVKTADGWSEPCNMGSNINTPGIETAPYIHPSGKIFFSSDGRPDSQGLDLYYTYKTDNGFVDPKKFDDDINSTRDDYGIYYSDDEKWGFITSNRDGRDQLYRFQRTFPEFDSCDSLQTLDLCYTLYEASAENYDTTTFECQWKFGDGTSSKGVEVDHCYEGPGEYVIELSVLDKTSGEEMFSLAQYELVIERAEQVEIEIPQVIKAGQPATFSASSESITDFRPLDFYWNMGNGDRVKGDKVTTIYEKPGTYRVECGTIDARNRNEKRCSWTMITVE